MKNTRYIIMIWLFTAGCASTGALDYETLRQAEHAAARISDYGVTATPAPEDMLIGVDVSDTSMSPNGTTKRFQLQGLPVSTAMQAALNDKQGAVATATDQEITAGTETAARLISPAQAKLAAQTFGGAGGGLADLENDPTPDLGGDLNTNGHDIVIGAGDAVVGLASVSAGPGGRVLPSQARSGGRTMPIW